jgi:hypothetical protein
MSRETLAVGDIRKIAIFCGLDTFFPRMSALILLAISRLNLAEKRILGQRAALEAQWSR